MTNIDASTLSASIDANTLSAIDELQMRYVAALDEQNMPEWLATFSEDEKASYSCNTAESWEAALPVALILDDCRARLQDRVTYVTQIWAGTFTEYRTRHLVQRTRCRRLEPDILEVKSNFVVTYTSAEVPQPEVFATGVYLDRIRREDRQMRFLSKTAIMDAHVLHRYMVFPL